MPAAPKLQVLYRRLGDIQFGWIPLKQSEAKSYNIYASVNPAGPYVLIKSNIQNKPDKQSGSIGTGAKVKTYIKDTDVPIPDKTTYYFKLTFIDQTNIESNINLSLVCVVYPAGVEWFWENEDEPKNNHNMAWVESRKRWEKVGLTDDGKLLTDATVNIGQITLGNVKVAARPDNVTVEYLLVDNNRELIARLDPNSISRIDDYEETNGVIPNIETTILTYTNISPFFIEKIACSGTSDAVFKFKINGSTRQTLRNSWNNRNIIFDFSTISTIFSADVAILDILFIYSVKNLFLFARASELHLTVIF